MGLTSALSKLLKGIISAKLKDINLLSNNTVIIAKEIKINMGGEHNYNAENKVLTIDYNSLSTEEQKIFMSELPKQLENYGTPILADNFSNTFTDFNSIVDLQKDVIDFFRGKIPNDDIIILQAAIYLKSVLDKNGDTSKIKGNIVSRYGQRGNNISNLYTAGYFDSWIKPLFKNFDKYSDIDKKNTLEIYNLIVNDYPFAIFVGRSMTKETLIKTITDKLAKNKEYGIGTLTVHGIGEENIRKINSALLEVDELGSEDYDVKYTKFKNIISVGIESVRTAI